MDNSDVNERYQAFMAQRQAEEAKTATAKAMYTPDQLVDEV